MEEIQEHTAAADSSLQALTEQNRTLLDSVKMLCDDKEVSDPTNPSVVTLLLSIPHFDMIRGKTLALVRYTMNAFYLR